MITPVSATLARLHDLLQCDDRTAVLAAMQEIDPNGCWTDQCAADEGLEPVSIPVARAAVRLWIHEHLMPEGQWTSP